MIYLEKKYYQNQYQIFLFKKILLFFYLNLSNLDAPTQPKSYLSYENRIQ